MVTNDEDTDAATTSVEGLVETGPEVGLINDRKGLLDVAGLGHRNDIAILEIKDTVLLEDWTQHGLNDNTWAGVRDERRLLMQLLGEEVDAQIAVLAGGGRGRDADNLAGAALENQEVTEADVVSWDGDGVWGTV